MPQILRTTLINDEAQAADGVVNFDLPVNPLSMILLTVKALNLNAAGGTYASPVTMLNMVTNVRITYRGASILDGSLLDLAILMARLTGRPINSMGGTNVVDEVRAVTVPLCLGRRAYDPKECFPATRRGDLILSLTTDVLTTALDTLILQAETVELLDAEPERFVKATTISKVFNATGEHDVELPIGNDLLGILLQTPVRPAAGSFNSWWGQTRLQVDNVETIYSLTNWETLHGELLSDKLHAWQFDQHVHGGNFTTTVQGDTQIPHTTDSVLAAYAYLDLDPLNDGQYALNTRGAARVNLRTNTETASATAARALPVELVTIAGGPAA
jgi:hypothetical protein